MKITPSARLASLTPYVRADLAVAPGKRIIQLAQNETSITPTEAVLEAIRTTATTANLYPDPESIDLRCAIATMHGLDPARIICGAGSMELLQVLSLAYLGPGDAALIPAHGFAFFRLTAQLAGARVHLVPESELKVDVDALLASVGRDAKAVFLANPGNPTGTYISRDELIRLRNALPDSILLVIDEAYAEFVNPDRYERVFDLADRGDTVVLRSFSKIYSLAGMRVGWGYCSEHIIADLRRIQVPTIVSAVAQAAAAAAMRDQETMVTNRNLIRARKAAFASAISQLGWETTQSETNFVLIRFGDDAESRRVDSYLRDHGVVLRRQSVVGLGHCLRAAIGSTEDMDFVEHRLRAWRDLEGQS